MDAPAEGEFDSADAYEESVALLRRFVSDQIAELVELSLDDDPAVTGSQRSLYASSSAEGAERRTALDTSETARTPSDIPRRELRARARRAREDDPSLTGLRRSTFQPLDDEDNADRQPRRGVTRCSRPWRGV